MFPAADHPVVSLIAYAGNLGVNSGAPQSVYQLDTRHAAADRRTRRCWHPASRWKLPGGQGTITFAGYQQWASLAITHDPGQLPALICGMAALGGLLLSFLVRRRRVFVRVRRARRQAPSCSSAGWPAPTPAAASRPSSRPWPPS